MSGYFTPNANVLKAQLHKEFKASTWAILWSSLGLFIEGQSYHDPRLFYVVGLVVVHDQVKWSAALRYKDAKGNVHKSPCVRGVDPMQAIQAIWPGYEWLEKLKPSLPPEHEDKEWRPAAPSEEATMK